MASDPNQIISAEWAFSCLPKRPVDCNKGDFGNVAVLGGSPGMTGAALLAAKTALLLGAGRVFAGLLDERVAFDPNTLEIMVCSAQHCLGIEPLGCLVLGPGLGLSAAARGWVVAALATPFPLLIDADGLNLIALDPKLSEALCARDGTTLLTPHPGEAGRLLGIPSSEIQKDRSAAIQALGQRYRAGVVLKGAGSLVHFPGRPSWLNTTGNPGMAAPGMGDVLAGMIAALAAQGLNMEQAAMLGVYLHGSAGDAAVSAGLGPVGLTAGELILAARRLLNGVE